MAGQRVWASLLAFEPDAAVLRAAVQDAVQDEYSVVVLRSVVGYLSPGARASCWDDFRS